MFSQIKRLVKHSSIYLIGAAFQSLIGFVLIPVYTRYLSPSEYGQLEILNTILLILNIILSFGFASALQKVHERDCKTNEEKKTLIGTIYLFVIPVASLITLIIALFAKFLTQITLNDIKYTPYIYLILITNLVVIFLNLSFAVLRVKEKSKKFALFSFGKFFFAVCLNIYFVVQLKLGVLGILFGNFLAQTILSITFLPTVLKSAKFAFSKRLFYKLSIFGFAIIPASIAMWIMDLSDRYFLKHFSDFHEVGLYSLGYKVGFLIYIGLVLPFQLAWPKISFAVASRKDCKKIYARTLTYFTFIASFAALFLSLFGKQIIQIIADPKFFQAYKIIPLIAFSYVLYGIHFVLVPGLHIKEKSKYYPIMIGVPAGLNLLLNYYFVPKFGMIGAATTTLICFALVVVLTYIITARFYAVRYEWIRILKLVFTILIALFLGFSISGFFWQKVFYNFLILLCFLVILYIIGFFDKEELKKIKLRLKL